MSCEHQLATGKREIPRAMRGKTCTREIECLILSYQRTLIEAIRPHGPQNRFRVGCRNHGTESSTPGATCRPEIDLPILRNIGPVWRFKSKWRNAPEINVRHR